MPHFAHNPLDSDQSSDCIDRSSDSLASLEPVDWCTDAFDVTVSLTGITKIIGHPLWFYWPQKMAQMAFDWSKIPYLSSLIILLWSFLIY